MKSVLDQLGDRFKTAMKAIGADGDPLIHAARDAKFGDYQSDCAMGLSKKLGRKPRDIATDLIANLDISDMCDPPEVAGPGFVNLRLKPEWLGSWLAQIPPAPATGGDRLGIDQTDRPQTIAVDLSSPNLAKEMHVGHLRSTVIGDCVARILEFAGHTVHRENHVGDWGTQFGMLVAYLRRTQPDVMATPDELRIADLETFYVEAKALFDADEDFKTESRETVVALQGGDPETVQIWKAFCDESLRHCHAIYDRLNVSLIDRGESFYADSMKEVVAELEKKRASDPSCDIAVSEGALCIFLDGHTTRDGDPLPLIVRKSDGGHNYATSDLATIRHRIDALKTDRIIYVVGVAQRQHFQMVFAAARKVGWVPESVSLEHLGFGNMLAESGRPFKTREGGAVKLKDLLDDAVTKARGVVEEKLASEGDQDARRLTEAEANQVAERVGIAAVKYFDLSHALQNDYKFSPTHMLALNGNTAPYMMYTYARIRSIGRKAELNLDDLPASAPILPDHPAERALALKLIQFADVLEVIESELRPNVLTDYLFDLSKLFSRFYDKKIGVRVIDASPEEVRLSRLRLCDLTARTLKLGLGLLGIETVEKM